MLPEVSDSDNRKGLISSLARDDRVVTFSSKKMTYTPGVNKGSPLTRATEKKIYIYAFLISDISYYPTCRYLVSNLKALGGRVTRSV